LGIKNTARRAKGVQMIFLFIRAQQAPWQWCGVESIFQEYWNTTWHGLGLRLRDILRKASIVCVIYTLFTNNNYVVIHSSLFL
jgi:hypothetical protein